MSKTLRVLACLLATLSICASRLAAQPVRVFIRAGIKTHGPNQHDHPRFLGEYTKLLNERGMKVDGAMEFPSAQQLESTDVLVIFAADGMKIVGDQRTNFEKYLRRGGGVVVIHDGVVADDQNEWCKQVLGGTWIWEKKAPGKTQTKWVEGEVGLCFVDTEHPISRGISNFDWKDEVYNQMDMAADVHVLAQSFVDVFNIWPQLWTYEKTWEGGSAPYRAFVSLPGHEYDSFQTPHYRTILLRGIAWAARRQNADEFCRPEELASLKYPAGGPKRAAEAMKTFQTHPEFNVSLVADENVAEKVMSLDWDPQGRLWVVETPEYPGGRDVNRNDFKAFWNRSQNPAGFPVGGKEPRQPRDRISILEDTNGDGVMDKRTVFADGLELPTSLVFYKDGVIISQAPDILWVRDTNGDGKADKMETLYTGWGTFDTHAVINNLRWGMDGWVYGTVGYTKGDVKSGDRTRSFGRINDGVYRFRPDGSMVEQVSANACNTWGCEVTPDGEVIYTTATCGIPILHVVMPEKILARGSVGGHGAYQNVIAENKIYPAFEEKRQPYVQIDWVGAWTAAAGSLVYDGGAWPAKWAPDDRYSFFMSETTRQLFHHEFLDPQGATYQGRKEAGREQTEFLASTDYWFRPIHSRVGPDGAVYLVDFYNQIAVHNDTRGPAHGARNAAARPDRDHHFTRVYRIQHRQARSLPTYRLNASNPQELVSMLRHPNGWVRGTANRLLTENPDRLNSALAELIELIRDNSAPVFGRVQALWLYATLARTHDVPWDADAFRGLMADASPAIRKNTVRVAAEFAAQPELRSRVKADNGDPERVNRAAIIERIQDSNDRVKINALMAAGEFPPSRDLADAVVAAWPGLKDKWLQSAAVGAASKDPALFLEACFGAKDPAFLADYVPHLARLAGNRNDGELAGRVMRLLAAQPASTDGLKAAALEALNAALGRDVVPAWTDGLATALRGLLAADRTAGSTLPFVARWDRNGALAAEVKPAIVKATAALKDAGLPDDLRGKVAVNLIGIRSLDAGIVPALASLLGAPGSSLELQRRIIDALGGTPEGGQALVPAFAKLANPLVDAAFGHILKRRESASAFLDLLADKTVPIATLGPARVHRMRTHGDAAIAKRAADVVESLAGPEQKEKNELIARLRPEIEKVGNPQNGKTLYTANCAGCHQFKNEGRNLAPNLNGMGAHGPADLLIHIVDPNRVVEPNFISTRIETKGGDTYDGVIDRENSSEVVLRDAAQDHTIRTADIASRTSTGRSLMPEGFESLGAEGLRDLLTYLCAEEGRFRILDLSGAFTANNSRGLYLSPENPGETVRFNRYGLRRIEDVPFDVISPDKSVANVVVLKGGAPNSWSRRELPQRVEVKVGVAASRLHFLGGVAGWGYPAVGEKVDACKVTVHFADGSQQVIVLKNGVEIADYNGRHDVPGSKSLNWTVGSGQIRWFSKDVQKSAVIEKLTLESYDNHVSPTFFGITAEVGGASGAKPTAASGPAVQWGTGIKTLLIGGGASHDYQRWFNLADVALLNGTGRITANYLEPQDVTVAAVESADVLLISANKAFPDPAVRSAIFAHANAGKGVVLLHPGLWYNWADWKDYNRVLAGGGSRGHDRYGEFDVQVSGTHPLIQGVPPSFRLSDELYYFEPDASGTPIKVLATAHSNAKNQTYAQVFVVEHPKARVAGITLGHDGVAHSHPAYQQLLKNAVYWVSRTPEATSNAK